VPSLGGDPGDTDAGTAPLVTCPARSECPVIRVADRPTASARVLRIRSIVPPEIAARPAPRPRLGGNSGAGAVPRTASQDATAATGRCRGVGRGRRRRPGRGGRIGLGVAHRQHQPGGLGLQVGQGEVGQIRAPQRGGEARDEGGVPGAESAGAVDAGDDPADFPALPAPTSQTTSRTPLDRIENKSRLLRPAHDLGPGRSSAVENGTSDTNGLWARSSDWLFTNKNRIFMLGNAGAPRPGRFRYRRSPLVAPNKPLFDAGRRRGP
jgi:hypothetical protein